jgi:glycosyltransferase involved in cell wall biosynthesis
MNPRYSLVIPVFNEAGNILPLLSSASDVLKTFRGANEFVLVNDGSTDGTSAELKEASKTWPQLRVIDHEKNLGQAAALMTGLRATSGEIILTLDGDGQNDPRDFPKLLEAVESGALDLACGWRVDRHDSRLRRILSRLGNAVRRTVLGDHLHDGGCQLRAFRREIIASLFPVDFLQSLLPAIAVASGFRVGEFPVRHHHRKRGRAHFGLRQLWWRPGIAMLAARRELRRRRQP